MYRATAPATWPGSGAAGITAGPGAISEPPGPASREPPDPGGRSRPAGRHPARSAGRKSHALPDQSPFLPVRAQTPITAGGSGDRRMRMALYTSGLAVVMTDGHMIKTPARRKPVG